MLQLQLLSLFCLTTFVCGSPASRQYAVGFETVISDVQEAIKALVDHRSNLLQNEIRKTCIGEDYMLMKVNIVKGPRLNDSVFENFAHWQNSCVFHVYDAGVVSLQKWCFEDPQRHLVYKQNKSESVLGGTQLMVETNCTLFDEDPDEFYRDLVDTFIKVFIIFASLAVLVILLNWVFRRDIVVIVNNVADKAKQVEEKLVEKKNEFKGKASDEITDKSLLLENQEENESA